MFLHITHFPFPSTPHSTESSNLCIGHCMSVSLNQNNVHLSTQRWGSGSQYFFPPPSIMLDKWIAQKSIIHQGDQKAQVLLWYVADKSVWCTSCVTEMLRLTYRLKTSVNCCLANSSSSSSSWSNKKWTSLVSYFVKKKKVERSGEKLFCKLIQVIMNLRKKKSSLPSPHHETLTVRNRHIYLITKKASNISAQSEDDPR